MTKSKTKTKKKATTKSSKPKPIIKEVKVPELCGMCTSAVLTLQSVSSMEFLQLAAPAIRDLGIMDLNEWGGGFENLYMEIWKVLFDEDRKLLPFWNPILVELRRNSTVGADRFTLAAALARVGATYAFVTMSMERHL